MSFKIPKTRILHNKEKSEMSPLRSEEVEKKAQEIKKKWDKILKQRLQEKEEREARSKEAEKRWKETIRKKREEAEQVRKEEEQAKIRKEAETLDVRTLCEQIDEIIKPSVEPFPEIVKHPVAPSGIQSFKKRPRCWKCGGRGHEIGDCKGLSKRELKAWSKKLGVDMHIKTPKKNAMRNMASAVTDLQELIPVPFPMIQQLTSAPPPLQDLDVFLNGDDSGNRPSWTEMCGL